MISDLPTKQIKACLSTITVTNIYQSFTYKMAAKINWNRYETKLRHCHRVYTQRGIYTAILSYANVAARQHGRSYLVYVFLSFVPKEKHVCSHN